MNSSSETGVRPDRTRGTPRGTPVPAAVTVSRRTLLKRLLGASLVGWLASIFYPVIRFLIPPPLGESKVSSLKVGTITDRWDNPYLIVQMGRIPVIVFKDKRGEYRALEATCTHLACIVQYLSEENSIWCACHNGRFDLSGKVISGPPPAPLASLAVSITEVGEIWISREQV